MVICGRFSKTIKILEIMSSITTEEKEVKIANFLDLNQKDFDWRYKEWQKLSRQQEGFSASLSKTIYWIGDVELDCIDKEKHIAPIYFFQKYGPPIKDAEYLREDDGCICENSKSRIYLYNLGKIHKHLLEAKKEGNKLFHVFLEESVDSKGFHQVSLLYYPKEDTNNIVYGTGSKKFWIKEPIEDWINCYSIELEKTIQRIVILSHEYYNWMK